jgi:hypothetical protein
MGVSGRNAMTMMTTVLWMMTTLMMDVDWRLVWLNCSKSSQLKLGNLTFNPYPANVENRVSS